MRIPRPLSATCVVSLLTFLAHVAPIHAQPAVARFDDCFSGNATLKLDISTVYAQITHSEGLGRHLNLTVIGTSGQQIVGLTDDSHPLSTLFTTSDILTFDIWANNSYFCSTLRPPSPLPASNDSTNFYCPINAGPFAFSSAIPLNRSLELVTLQTRLRAVDSLSNELMCIDVVSTPLQPGTLNSVYGHARIVLWVSVALAAAFWLLVGIARLSSAWGRRAAWSGRGILSRIESLGFVVASAVSGEGFAKSPALLRFATPSLRDIFFHTQWCAVVSMVAVDWPEFVYPLLSQTSWATLSYNITLVQGDAIHWDPLSTPAFNPPSDFADQLSDQSSPLFIDTSVPNTLFTLPSDATNGISSFAYTIGVRPQDLFGICIILFLAILAGTIALSLLFWAVDALASFSSRALVSGRPTGAFGIRSPRYASASKDALDTVSPGHTNEEDKSSSGPLFFRSSRFPAHRRPWTKIRPDFSSFHFSVLHGNLVRILMLFHLPVTIFSCYQMTLGRPHASLASIVLAAVSFAVFSIVIPVLLVVRLTLTSTSKLYDETWTLLSLGPLYNHYRHGSQLFASLFFATNVALGVTVGCGQKSGTAQAIIMLVIEVVSALVTSVWLPWGHGASMGLISFLFCVARIVIAVLLVTLTPTVSIGGQAGQWVAYVILFILAFVYLAFILMFVCKIVEAFVRIFGGVGFDRSRHAADGGLMGACGLAGCCGSRRHRKRRHRAKQSDLPLTASQATFTRSQKDVTPTASQPPSVLKPEHALRPYREDTDDESGFIMGAWQPFPRPGYSVIEGDPSSPRIESPSLTKSGFSRVGGGRAHYDSPYAIATSSTQTFPSVERGTPSNRNSMDIGLQPPTAMELERRVNNLPPGAMAPHVRTKSQTAVIENSQAMIAMASTGQQAAPGTSQRRQSIRPEIVSPVVDDEDLSDEDVPRKKWYTKWKSRRHSEGDGSLPSPSQDLSPPTAAGTGGGRSFVVVRKRRASQPLSPPPNPSSDSQGPSSFVVIRGKDAAPSGPS
ncbi:hypothetical protein OF83DRAFT_1049176 [Amylostereum chailletii]|nr:hypothetical protein OF83DRAFT_1049176 [Amylostereum chailletii]